uniref:CSON003887 protein n=1 Tax=Culicoides sonorensis TaxID=179676 RepID=A0A336L3U5_CULSO
MEVVSVETGEEDEEEIVKKKETKVEKILKKLNVCLTDLTLLVIFSLPIIVFYAWRQKNGFKTGFFCNDNSIRYPYRETKISQSSIAIQTLLGPPIIFVVIELFTILRKRGLENKFKYFGKSVYYRITRYFHGFFICMSFTYVPKLFRGNLRPHFIDACNPNVDCNATQNQFKFIQDYECWNEVSIDVYMSFPSVHTSASVFVAVYLIFYLWKRIKWNKLRICLQFLLFLYAYFISLSRIHEHYHHPSDVIAGTIIGVLSSYAAVKYFEGFFTKI